MVIRNKFFKIRLFDHIFHLQSVATRRLGKFHRWCEGKRTRNFLFNTKKRWPLIINNYVHLSAQTVVDYDLGSLGEYPPAVSFILDSNYGYSAVIIRLLMMMMMMIIIIIAK